MAKPYDTRLIMMVSQMPFETPDMNQFCKLMPIMYVDGMSAAASDFPNDGEIWWMLNARTAPLAVAGRLLVGSIEDAIRYNETDQFSSRFQVQRDSIQDLELKDGVEVLSIPSSAIDDVHDLVSSGYRLSLPSQPTAQVMLRWRGNVYGPFRTRRDAASAAKVEASVSFTPSDTDLTVYRLAEADFDTATEGRRFQISERVSTTAQRRGDVYKLETIRHELVLASGYERIFTGQPDKLVLEPVEQKLQRYAKQCLTRKRRQEFRALLEELEVAGRESNDAEDLIRTVSRIKDATRQQDAALDAVAKALLESGLLGEDRVRKAEHEFAEKYVQDRAAQLQAKAQEKLTSLDTELRTAQRNLQDVQARLSKEEADRRGTLERELAARRQEADASIDAERTQLEERRQELDRQQTALKRNLEQVTKELRDAGDGVVNRFLTIAPLLGSMGAMLRPQPETDAKPSQSDDTARVESKFKLPKYLVATETADSSPLAEEEFFDRFRQFVEASGFVYRPLDLQRFHLSAKCGDMTVLGGPSGTGKSSLPMLYAKALLGDETASDRPGCLMVNVNPSWMDVRDLLGHMNALNGKYHPTETGLFQRLICAHEESRARGKATGLYLVCFDEMNLSQAEHYFSDFLMVLDRELDGRVIQCFSPEASHPDNPFRPYARLPLSAGVKFVGTVNFDETTRLLSDRFLDRVNLVRLVPGALPNVSRSEGEAPARATGRLVTLNDFSSWITDAALPAELGSLLDSIRPLLSRIGCPLSPRVYRAVCRFVASAQDIMPLPVAFDVQIAQRVIPKVRGLVTKAQLDSLDELMRTMNATSTCAFEESLPLLEDIRESASARAWDLED